MATPHHVDRYLELVDPLLRIDDMRAEVVRAERRAPDTVTLTLRPTRHWAGFLPGQFVQVGVVIDGVRHTRCFSPANSAARGDVVELTVKAHPDGFVSRHLVDHAKPGDVLDLEQADGAFHLPAERPERILLVSGGSGITPVMAMLRTLVDEGYDGTVTFVHYSRSMADVAYRDELDRIAREVPGVDVVYGFPDSADAGRLDGLFGMHHLDAVAPWYREAPTYLCGPPALMNAVREGYRDAGIDELLHTEEFTPPAIVPDDDAGGEIHFSRSDVRAESTGAATLLEQAEAAGLTPEYGCRMGICFTCTSVKKTGCTKNVRTGETDTESDKEIQLCVSVPVGDVTLDI
ncbi:ferredoxin reductase [Rhodococcus rhodnii]|uniref:Oxidoreductase n=2 Tax=Rhodococcus rhodnii TaxID=38312 RepID=R7WIT1_9NOCA|nr:ferredoxin reductase [Rhodococcus rhodnii]EOM75152.1 oxidoreductase [Rhodococcus rhodnii LMG 5362]TXG91590.1 ferredoxin reductase [Rhodococcus rhodnii]